MTFWELYESLCRNEDLSPSGSKMQQVTGVSSAAITGWKKGKTPKPEVIKKIADYFGISTDYIYETIYHSLTNEPIMFRLPLKKEIELSDDELDLITRYRELSEDGKIKVKSALIDEERHHVRGN